MCIVWIYIKIPTFIFKYKKRKRKSQYGHSLEENIKNENIFSNIESTVAYNLYVIDLDQDL